MTGDEITEYTSVYGTGVSLISPRSMTMDKLTKYTNVSEMVKAVSEEQAFPDEFSKQVAGRCLIKMLTVLRTRKNLTQADVAKTLGCSQGKVSKLESSNDEDISFGDLVTFTAAVGHEIRLILVPQGQSLVSEVKLHAFIIKRLLDRMVDLAGGDGAMTEGVVRFLEEAAFNLVRLVKQTAAALPPMPVEPARPLLVEAFEREDEEEVTTPGRIESRTHATHATVGRMPCDA